MIVDVITLIIASICSRKVGRVNFQGLFLLLQMQTSVSFVANSTKFTFFLEMISNVAVQTNFCRKHPLSGFCPYTFLYNFRNSAFKVEFQHPEMQALVAWPSFYRGHVDAYK
jgi:hypothetical protein